MEGFHDSKVCPEGLPGEICRLIENIGYAEVLIYEHFVEQGRTWEEILEALKFLVDTKEVEVTHRLGSFVFRWWNHQIDDHGSCLY